MRDIRGDLQDRAGFLEEQLNAAQAQFEKRMELFTREHELKIHDLQAELEAVSMLMEREYRRIMSAPDVEEERRQAAPEQHAPAAAAPETYEEPDYPEEEPELLPEEEPYDEPAVAEGDPDGGKARGKRKGKAGVIDTAMGDRVMPGAQSQDVMEIDLSDMDDAPIFTDADWADEPDNVDDYFED